MFLFPPPQFYYFPSSFSNSLPVHNINLSPPPPRSFFYPPPPHLSLFSLRCYSLLHNFIIFPHSWIPSLSTILIFPRLLLIFFPPPSQFLLFPPLNLDFPPPPQFHYFPSSTSTSFILYIFPSTNTSTSYRPHTDSTLTPDRPNIDPRLNFFSTQLGE